MPANETHIAVLTDSVTGLRGVRDVLSNLSHQVGTVLSELCDFDVADNIVSASDEIQLEIENTVEQVSLLTSKLSDLISKIEELNNENNIEDSD